MIDGKKLGDVGFEYLGVPYSEMDCQAFVERCLKDCGLSMNLAGSNAWFREVRNNGVILTPEECVKQHGSVPKGAFLFILKQDGKEPEKYKPDGLGNASHIGICTGSRGKGAINSSSSKGCVCESEFHGKSINGGWNRVGLWNKVDYDGEPVTPDDPMEGVATVTAPNGGTVKMRAKPSKDCKLYWDVPNGTIVSLVDWAEDWSKIIWNGLTGYMMSEFLVRGEVVPGEPDEDGNIIAVPRAELLKIYDALGNILGVRG